MSTDQDPMLGDAATQDAYKAHVAKLMADAVQEVRAERRNPPQQPQVNPVMIGAAGFGSGISAE